MYINSEFTAGDPEFTPMSKAEMLAILKENELQLKALVRWLTPSKNEDVKALVEAEADFQAVLASVRDSESREEGPCEF